jgi:hypothetical protein
MEKIDALITMYRETGFWGIVSATLISFLLVAGYELIRGIMRQVLEKRLPGIFAKPDHTKSGFFSLIDILIYFKIPRMTIPCPLRRKIFSRLLVSYFTAFRDRAREKINLRDLDKLSPEELDGFWKTFIYTSVDRAEEAAIKDGIPAIAIEKYRVRFDKTLKLIILTSEQICGSSNVYDSNSEKTLAIMNFLGIFLDLALVDANETMMEINGELSQEEYAGVRCSLCRQECVHKVPAKD